MTLINYSGLKYFASEYYLNTLSKAYKLSIDVIYNNEEICIKSIIRILPFIFNEHIYKNISNDIFNLLNNIKENQSEYSKIAEELLIQYFNFENS